MPGRGRAAGIPRVVAVAGRRALTAGIAREDAAGGYGEVDRRGGRRSGWRGEPYGVLYRGREPDDGDGREVRFRRRGEVPGAGGGAR